jgi:hypothetical protein
VELRIRSGGIISGAFDNQLAVKQVVTLLPLLFLFFINDIIHDISANTNDNIVDRNPNWLSISVSSSSDHESKRSVKIFVNNFESTLNKSIGR